MRKKDRRTLTALLRKFVIREDRAELGNNTGPRFKSELINPRKGTPTSYIAKYISKNIDGRGLAKEISKETGKSLRDSAEHVSAWASLHLRSAVALLRYSRTSGLSRAAFAGRAGRESAGR